MQSHNFWVSEWSETMMKDTDENTKKAVKTENVY